MQEFRGRVAVVTGAASGIGRGLAGRFAEEGMRVVLADVERPALDAAVGELRDAGHEVLGVLTDVSDPRAVEELAERAFDEFGAVHILCNNAGVAARGDWGALYSGDRPRPVWEHPLEDWHWTFGVNLWGVVHGIRSFVPRLVVQAERGEESHIVNTASVLSFQGAGDLVIYGATKFAVGRITESLYLQLRALGVPIGVSALCPGGVGTRSYDAERNRPDALRAGSLPSDAGAGARRDVVAERFREQMPPTEVADHVVRGIREQRLYIFTHDDADEAIRHRTTSIIERRNPDWGQARGS